MITGILLGVSMSLFITSAIMMYSGYTGILQENLFTGAAIGTNTLISYSFIVFILSLVAILFFVFKLKKNFNKWPKS